MYDTGTERSGGSLGEALSNGSVTSATIGRGGGGGGGGASSSAAAAAPSKNAFPALQAATSGSASRAGGAGGSASGAPPPSVPDDTVAALLRSLKAKPDEGPTPFLLLERFDVRRMGDDDVHTWLAGNAAGAQQSRLFRRHAPRARRCSERQRSRRRCGCC